MAMDSTTGGWRVSPRFNAIAVTPRRLLLVGADSTHLFTETSAASGLMHSIYASAQRAGRVEPRAGGRRPMPWVEEDWQKGAA